MSDALTLARPYARAAFSIAQEMQEQDAWSKALQYSAQIASDPAVSARIVNPTLTPEQCVQLVLVDGAPSTYVRFLEEPVQAGRIGQLSEISQLFHQLRAEEEGIVRAKLSVSHPVSPDQQQRIIDALKRRFNKQIALTTVVDPSLLGGAVVEANGVVIDGSAQGKLSRLKDLFAFSSF